MSYLENPESNPYAAPVSEIVDQELMHPSAYAGYAGFWRRSAALFIDWIVLQVVQFVYMLVAFVALPLAGNNLTAQRSLIVVLYLLIVAGVLAYFAGMESSARQATLGKMAMGIKVTDLYGRRISTGRAVGRLFGKAVSFLIVYVGFLMAAFTQKKQGLHDLMAGTLVLKTR